MLEFKCDLSPLDTCAKTFGLPLMLLFVQVPEPWLDGNWLPDLGLGLEDCMLTPLLA